MNSSNEAVAFLQQPVHPYQAEAGKTSFTSISMIHCFSNSVKKRRNKLLHRNLLLLFCLQHTKIP